MASKDNGQATTAPGDRHDFTQLVETIPFAIFALDGSGVITYGNSAFAELLGGDASARLGTTWSELLEPADARRWLEFTSTLLSGTERSAEFWFAANDRERWQARVSCQLGYRDRSVSGIQGFVQPVQKATPAHGIDQSMFNHELRSREMKVVRRLADGFVVEMKGVLSSVIGLASVLETEFEPGSPACRDVQEILAAALTGVELSRNLLGISVDQSAPREPLQVNVLVGKLTALWERTKRGRVEVEARLNATKTVQGNPSQISRIMVNLGVNAIEAMASDGILTFATEDLIVSHDEAPSKSFSGLTQGEYVVLRVSDTGAGMDTDTLSQAFEPFFTTKPTRVSSGLGLSVVFHIVKQHGGQIRVYSKRGLGTTVTIYLPAYDSALPHTEEPSEKLEVGPSQQRTILLVDDEVHILRVGRRLLEKLGHDVRTASSGAEALEQFAERPDEIALVLLDLMMMDMDGSEVLRRIREIDAHAPVVICTAMGYVETDPEFSEIGADGLLSKPFDLHRLSSTIEQYARKD